MSVIYIYLGILYFYLLSLVTVLRQIQEIYSFKFL